MVDNIVELDDGNKYVLMEEQKLDNNNYYFGLKLTENEEPSNEYLFFLEENIDGDICLTPVIDEGVKGILLTLFTAEFVNMSYDIK